MNIKSPKTFRFLLALCLISALAVMAAPPLSSAQQSKQDFTLYNKTGMSITEMYVSPASKDDWGEDILGVDTLPNGDDTTIHFSPKERAATWDIKLVDENGKDHIRYNFNLLNVSEITVRSNGDGSWYWNWK
jgi:hypothetical protein